MGPQPIALALVALLVVVGTLSAEEREFVSGEVAGRPAVICAQRHQEFAALIEDLGEAPSFAGDKLFNALRAMTRAYRTCAQGEVSKAMSMYDEAVLRPIFSAGAAR